MEATRIAATVFYFPVYSGYENKLKKVLTWTTRYDNTIGIMKTKFSISMDNDLLQEIDSLAKKENRTRSNLIERLLWGVINQPKMCKSTEEVISATGGNK